MKRPYYLFLALILAISASNPVSGDEKFVAAMGGDGFQHVEIRAGSYFFKPNHIAVKVNTPVELKVKKEAGIIPHNMVADSPEAGIKFKVKLAGEFKTLRFTPLKIGMYKFYCDKRFLFFKSHREKGMEGVIEVVP